jgi:fibronectin-binding autotransporter adhesin
MKSIIVTIGARLAWVAVGSGRFPVGVNCTLPVLALMAWLVSIPASAAINTFSTGTNFNNAPSWSVGSAPVSSSNTGSFTDSLYTSSSGTTLGSTSSTFFLQSYNVTNGSTYRLLSTSGGVTQYRAGNTTGNVEGVSFTNGVSGSTNDLVYLANNSGLTISGTTSQGFETRLNVRVSGNFRIETGSVLTVEGPISSSAASAYTITKVGGGKVVMGGTNTYTAMTTIEEGTVEYATNNVTADTAPITVSGGLWNLRAFNDTVGTVTLTSGTIAGSGGLTIKNDSQFSGGVVSASLSGTSGFTLPTSAGTVVFSGANTYSGTSRVSGGTLRVMSAAALSSSSTLNSGGSSSDSSTLDFGAPSLSYQMSALSVGGIMRFTSSTGSASKITFQATSGNGFSGGASNKTLEADANTTVEVSGTFDLASAALSQSRVGRFQGAGNFIFNSPFIGTGTSGALTAGFSVLQSATVRLNAAGSYTGNTDVSGGRLIAGNASAFGTGTVTVSGSGVLDLNSLAVANTITNNGGTILNAASYAGTQSLLGSSTFNSLSGTLNVGSGGKATLIGSIAATVATLTGGTAELASGGSLTQSSVANAGTFLFSGTADASLATAFSGAGNFRKESASILSLSGSSFFGAGTQITAGGLLITGSVGGGLVDVSSAASIGGTGRIGGDLNLQAGATFSFVAGNTLAVTGSATFGGFGVDDILGLSSSTPDGTYTLMSGLINFANVSNVGAGNAVSLGGNKSAYLQQGSLQLVVVPEPSVVVVGMAGLAMALAAVRKRKN